MAGQVKSQISDKLYEVTLDDLYDLDQGLEVDLYKINVFNKDIMIAPGKVMSDEKKGVHFCYVYVVKNGKAIAKLGIYETHVKSGEVYDLTEFEGREFLLFDQYYNDPGILVEYEMKEEREVDNIFDYLKRFLKPVRNATASIKEQLAKVRNISKRFASDFPDQTQYSILLKLFKQQKPYDKAWLDSFKEKRENWMFILIVLEVIFDIKFIFEDSDGLENELRNMVRSRPNESTTIIRVSLEDIPRHVTNENRPTQHKARPESTFLEEEEELKPPSRFPSPKEESAEPAISLATRKSSAEERAESPPAISFATRKSSAEERAESPQAKSSTESPERAQSPPVRSFTSKKPSSAEERAVSPPVRSFTSRTSTKATSPERAESPTNTVDVKTFSPLATEPSKPRRIVRSAPPTKLKNKNNV